MNLLPLPRYLTDSPRYPTVYTVSHRFPTVWHGNSPNCHDIPRYPSELLPYPTVSRCIAWHPTDLPRHLTDFPRHLTESPRHPTVSELPRYPMVFHGISLALLSLCRDIILPYPLDLSR